MKKIAWLLSLCLLVTWFAGCVGDPADPTETAAPTEPEKLFITSDEVDLRQMVVDYMLAMANVQWTAGVTIDYSSYSSSLVYESGKTYLGMVYNNNRNGYEAFMDLLDENNCHTGTITGWSSAVGNSCATCIEHAWQLISPTVEYEYSIDMMPYYENTGVVPIGDIDWSCYNGTNTNSIISQHDRQTIFEAYAQMLPGDALVRYQNTGGHALMLTKEPTIVRNPDGSINMVQSYLYLTDQNNRLHNRREYPSSWEVDRPMTFSNAFQEGYLPVTVAELRDGQAPVPTFTVTAPTAENLSAGNVKGSVRSNYCLNTLRMELRSGETLVATAVAHPYERSCGFSDLGKDLKIADLPAGQYTLTIIAEVGLATQTIVETTFTK
ncbi:MAG: hypothetical protein E7436_03410 [Ruminococcaceae bacterium]|nr:hypothetical protein [Oscillospiraceae bacterium]